MEDGSGREQVGGDGNTERRAGGGSPTEGTPASRDARGRWARGNRAGEQFAPGNKKGRPFQPGQSGNPGGVPGRQGDPPKEQRGLKAAAAEKAGGSMRFGAEALGQAKRRDEEYKRRRQLLSGRGRRGRLSRAKIWGKNSGGPAPYRAKAQPVEPPVEPTVEELADRATEELRGLGWGLWGRRS